MTNGQEIPGDEFLWRGVFDRRRARKQKVRYNDFLERHGVQEVSVNRLDKAEDAERKRIVGLVERERGQTFRRWAAILAKHGTDNDRTIKLSPKNDNPYHADIVLPEHNGDEESYRRFQKQHAKWMAEKAVWVLPLGVHA